MQPTPRGRRHGTRSCYAMGCRKDECRAAASEYSRQYSQIRKLYSGTDRLVDPAPAIKHIRHLRAQGMGRGAIADAAGMTRPQVFELDHEVRKYIRRSTEQKILSVQLETRLVSAAGTRRRLQALAAIGHRLADLADELDTTQVYASKITTGETRMVFRSTHERVARVYERLSMVPGASIITKNRAIAKGWAPPLAWDDERIDDPAAEPYGIRGKVREARRGFDLDEWVELVDTGETPERAAERCGVTLSAVERAAWRAGRTDTAASAAKARKRWSA